MPNVPQLIPENQFPKQAIQASVQEQPPVASLAGSSQIFTWNIASASDEITPWGRNVTVRDRQLRDFWPSEPFLAGAIYNNSLRDATFDWEVTGPEKVAAAVTDMLKSAIAGDTFGWVPFMKKLSLDLQTQDNGSFIELIRDPGMDANSRFKNESAPVIGIAHLDSNACIRTGRIDYPIVYTDLNGRQHKMAWYQVLPFADYPSPIQSMYGTGYCGVTRILRFAQIMRSILIYTNEKVSGRHIKQIHFVSGVSRQDIKDEMGRQQEDANNAGMLRFIPASILASLDPEKPVSTASIDLASLPDGFSFDENMKWYISVLALGFGVDYQEYAPLPGGNIGSSAQSMILHRKGNAKGPADFMRSLSEAFKNYGVLPRGCELTWKDRDEQEELERAQVRKSVMEEYALALRNFVLTPEAARKDAVARGIYDQAIIAGIEKDYGLGMIGAPKQMVGGTGGNTMAEDARRTPTGAQSETAGARLEKEISEQRKGFLDVIREIGKPREVVKEKVSPPVVNVDVHNHPGKPPVVNVNPQLHADLTARLVQPVQKQKTDSALTAAINKLAQAFSAQKAPEVKVENVVNVPEQQPAQVTVHSPVTVNMPERKPKSVEIEYDKQGKPIGLKPSN